MDDRVCTDRTTPAIRFEGTAIFGRVLWLLLSPNGAVNDAEMRSREDIQRPLLDWRGSAQLRPLRAEQIAVVEVPTLWVPANSFDIRGARFQELSKLWCELRFCTRN